MIGIRVLCTNIRSLNRNYDELCVLLEAQKHSYDVIALSETWIEEDHLKFFPLVGFRSYIRSRTDGRRLGGVVLYIKESLKVIRCEEIEILGADALKLQISMQLTSNTANDNLENLISLLLLYRDWGYSVERFITNLDSAL